jgi:hypothetical protein
MTDLLGAAAPASSRERLPLWAATTLTLALTLVACEACGPSQAERRAAVDHALDSTHGAWGEAVQRAQAFQVGRAADAASAEVSAAAGGFRFSGAEAFEATCRGLVARGELEEAVACVEEAAEQGFTGPALSYAAADALAGLGRHSEARAALYALRDGMARDADADAELTGRILAAFRDDPLFLRPTLTLEAGVHLDTIRSLGGGSTITLKFKLNDENVAAFKPDQTRRQSNYRAEVAAYRLCPMVRCGFEVPYSFEARIERREFMRLYGVRSLDPEYLATLEGYAVNFVDLLWRRDDADGADYLYGVWKDWVPHFTGFAIEYTDVWDEWVEWDGDAAELEQPLADALRPLRGRDRGRYDEMMQEAGELTTRGLAQQISNLIAFDFLINNWDRFSGAYYGVNCQFASGRFVSIDNGAGFMSRSPDRPRERLHQVTRFSRSLVREVRLMDTEALLPILFPDPTDDERSRWEAFRARRQELLDYVDGLIAEHGEDAVLFFE